MALELTNEEQAVLADIVDEELRDLKEEIYKTETFEYKEQLQKREDLLEKLLAKLKQ